MIRRQRPAALPRVESPSEFMGLYIQIRGTGRERAGVGAVCAQPLRRLPSFQDQSDLGAPAGTIVQTIKVDSLSRNIGEPGLPSRNTGATLCQSCETRKRF